MKAHVLIDAIVRQTTVLIAQLATAGGVRAPLAHVASQMFLDLANELSASAGSIGRKRPIRRRGSAFPVTSARRWRRSRSGGSRSTSAAKYAEATRWFRTHLVEQPGGRLARDAHGRLVESLQAVELLRGVWRSSVCPPGHAAT